MTDCSNSPYAKQTTPYTKQGNKYTKKTSPYSSKSNKYTSKTTPYSELRFCPILLQENGWALLQENGSKILL